MAAWSTTFRKSKVKPILIMWMFTLAIGHIFYNFANADPNRHFQICPTDSVEDLPFDRYQAPVLGPAWRQSLQDLALSQQTAGPFRRCLYSCFHTAGYIGRTRQQIGIYPNYPRSPGNRTRIVMFWRGYVGLAALTLLTDDKRGRLPDRIQKLGFTWQPFRRSNDDSRPPQRIDAVALVRLCTQICSVAEYIMLGSSSPSRGRPAAQR